MPIYVFRCKRCGHTTEKLLGINEKSKEITCEACGSKELQKVTAPFFSSGCGTAGGYRFG
ncbi:MAG TPA: zinc ribbon domain-containing protein [Dehalococcoidales bacterium]|nr:zinc ribbon domain-containing protein [Dehalococcoidales bacterium]